MLQVLSFGQLAPLQTFHSLLCFKINIVYLEG